MSGCLEKNFQVELRDLENDRTQGMKEKRSLLTS